MPDPRMHVSGFTGKTLGTEQFKIKEYQQAAVHYTESIEIVATNPAVWCGNFDIILGPFFFSRGFLSSVPTMPCPPRDVLLSTCCPCMGC